MLLYAAMLVDLIRTGTEERRGENELLLDLLTPIAKSWPSEFCLEANKHAIQILGGYGYTRDYPVERLYRDNRLNPIHEGTHGVQALDLLGRKVTQANGAGLKALADRILADVDRAREFEPLRERAKILADHLSELIVTTDRLVAALSGRRRLALANATIYLDMIGHVVIAWMWLRQSIAAVRQLESNAGDRDFLQGKLAACQFFFAYELPKTRTQRALLDRLDDTTLSMKPEWF